MNFVSRITCVGSFFLLFFCLSGCNHESDGSSNAAPEADKDVLMAIGTFDVVPPNLKPGEEILDRNETPIWIMQRLNEAGVQARILSCVGPHPSAVQAGNVPNTQSIEKPLESSTSLSEYILMSIPSSGVREAEKAGLFVVDQNKGGRFDPEIYPYYECDCKQSS